MSTFIFDGEQKMYKNTVVIIPSRLGSQRLSEKPLKQIGNKKMIEHVIDRAKESGIEAIYVATDSEKIAEVVRATGVHVIMTDPSLPSGTDRVHDAFTRIEGREKINYVINLQGDMPFVDPKILSSVVEKLEGGQFDIVTPVVKAPASVAQSNSNVKVVKDLSDKALYFSRSLIPHGQEGDYLCHIGIYGFEKNTLAKFVSLPPSELEKTEKLEQLRAMENGIEIGLCYADKYPISVDTQEDLDKAIIEFNSR